MKFPFPVNSTEYYMLINAYVCSMRNLLLILTVLTIINSCTGQNSAPSKKSNMNKLKYSSSPYLQQHADNPVHWQEWSDEALQRAKDENKPLLISIGYAACHWCHVMEHESFSDEEVAAFMNENFICIKVDREERPDVDQVYMNAVQLVSGSGGWPLNAFALPDGKPFFAGTYYNRAQWMELLSKISTLYKDDNQKIVEYANQLTKGINTNQLSIKSANSDFDIDGYDKLFDSWKSQIDFRKGGFNRAPKFPLPIAWEFILQYYYLTTNKRAIEAVTVTLDEMAKGGIYDQIGGGFARYSVDEYWKVPHFEKMLYDNAQLVSLYSHAYQITKNGRYKEIIEQTLDFISRELTSSEGAFYSSLNADSEGEEGKFYIWDYQEFFQVVGDGNKDLLSDYYQISKNGNWEDGKNILLPVSSKRKFAEKHNIELEQFNSILKIADANLLTHREKRERPSTDNKVLTSWNALMIRAYIDAYRALGDENYLNLAIKSTKFIEQNMFTNDGILYRNYMNGKASIYAFHDDYALLAQACIELYSVTFNIHWLNLSDRLTNNCIEHFLDKETGMFFYTSDISENLIARKYELTDNVIPSSNSVMANVLLKLGHFYDNEDYITMSKRMLAHVMDDVKKSGPWYANWAVLYGLLSYRPFEIAIMGQEASTFNFELQSYYLPTSLFLGGDIENLPLLKSKLVSNKTIIYVCKDKTCNLPVSTVKDALIQIN